MYRIAAAALALSLPAVAAAQSAGPVERQQQRVRQVVVYGSDACPPSTADEIVVCVRRPENERLRIPESLRTTPPDPGNQPWAERVETLREVQETGIGSCTAVGPGGPTGCLQERIEEWREGQANPDPVTPPN